MISKDTYFEPKNSFPNSPSEKYHSVQDDNELEIKQVNSRRLDLDNEDSYGSSFEEDDGKDVKNKDIKDYLRESIQLITETSKQK